MENPNSNDMVVRESRLPTPVCWSFFDLDDRLRGRLAISKVGALDYPPGVTILISGCNAYNPDLAFAEWPNRMGCLYLESHEYEFIPSNVERMGGERPKTSTNKNDEK